MYSGTVASYRYGRTIRGHYPYVATRESIWTPRRVCRLSPFLIGDMRLMSPKQTGAGAAKLISQIANSRVAASPVRALAREGVPDVTAWDE
jgi:hypothetical protein